jgi:hypothetical protein
VRAREAGIAIGVAVVAAFALAMRWHRAAPVRPAPATSASAVAASVDAGPPEPPIVSASVADASEVDATDPPEHLVEADYPSVADGPFADDVAFCAHTSTLPEDFAVWSATTDDAGACLASADSWEVGGAKFQTLRRIEGACAYGLSVRATRGTFQLPTAFGSPQCGDTHYPIDAEIAQRREVHGVLVVVIRLAAHTHHHFDEHGFETDEATMVFTERTIACRDAGDKLRCAVVETGSAPESRMTIATAPWRATRRVEVRGDGSLSVVDLTQL